MKKYITILLALCIVSLGFSQTVLKPKEKVYSSQFQKLMKYKLAEKNTTMAIWLGKQYLGQTDKIENTNKNDINNQIQNIANLLNNPKPNRSDKDV